MSMRLPGSLLSDDAIDPFYMYDDPTTQFHRDAELRQAATRAWAATDSRARDTFVCTTCQARILHGR